jgi:cell division protein FtsN
MKKHYSKRNTTSSLFSFLKKGTQLLVVFVTGYLSASFIDVKQVGGWLSSHLSTDKSTIPSTRLAQKELERPKPKLEFYTLLTAKHVTGATTPALPSPAPAQPVSKTPVVAQNSKAITIPVSSPSLAKMMVQGTKQLPVPHITEPVTSKNKLSYTIQVAAFRTRHDAEHMKASLLLKGFEANVQAIASNRVTWFRVMVGPFASRELAEKTQIALARRERVSGMIRKVDV